MASAADLELKQGGEEEEEEEEEDGLLSFPLHDDVEVPRGREVCSRCK